MTYDRDYFESSDQSIGYRQEGFRDFAAHWAAVDRILSMHPINTLEIGCARGYVVKKITAHGIPATGMEISPHCYHTRATDNFVVHDIEKSPWPFAPKQFDLLFSDSVLEHLHYEYIDEVVKEITRVSARSLHGVPITDSGQTRDQFMGDSTHVIFESKAWWEEKFKQADPNHVVTISGNIAGDANYQFEVPALSYDGADLVKLNIGSFINMFYYGWTNTDNIDMSSFAEHNGYIFRRHDANTPFPIKDETIDFIFSSHMLEHLTRNNGIVFLKECHRIMKYGAVIRIAVPDVEMLMDDYINGDLDFLKHISPGAEAAICDIDKFSEVALMNHHQIFDRCKLTTLLKAVGFSDVREHSAFESRSKILENETIVSHPTLSLVVEGTKTVLSI